jgi:MFS family permease
MWPFQLDVLASSASLFMGLGSFLWIPFSIAIGTRPVFLLCTVVLMAGTVLAGFSGSFYQHLAARSFPGLALGACMSTVGCPTQSGLPGTILMPKKILLMVIDLTFIYQRSHAVASFWSLCAVSSNLVILPTSQIISVGGIWRAFYWAWISTSIISVFLAFFSRLETYFHKPAVAFDGHILAQSVTEKLTVYANWQEMPGGKELPETPKRSEWWGISR